MAMIMKTDVFQNVMPCQLAGGHQLLQEHVASIFKVSSSYRQHIHMKCCYLYSTHFGATCCLQLLLILNGLIISNSVLGSPVFCHTFDSSEHACFPNIPSPPSLDLLYQMHGIVIFLICMFIRLFNLICVLQNVFSRCNIMANANMSPQLCRLFSYWLQCSQF